MKKIPQISQIIAEKSAQIGGKNNLIVKVKSHE
jgi:hypothetical protein